LNILEKIHQRAKNNTQRIVLPESTDDRVLNAAIRAQNDGIAQITLIGDVDSINLRAKQSGLSLNNIEIKKPEASNTDVYANTLYELRKHKGMTLEQAASLATQPLILGALMVHLDQADGMVAGAISATADVVRPALQCVGMDKQAKLVSSFFLMIFDQEFHPIKGAKIFTDCGLVINPNASELADIAFAAAQSAKSLLDEEPRLALLSFSTNGSAKHESIDKVVEAKRLLLESTPDIKVDGEIQLDAALVPEICERKLPNSQVNGNANVLVFPNLEAGNIGYKLTERLGQAKAIGPLLQGLKRPINDLSRGCSEEDIYNVVAITAVQAQR